jgi:hypothetical protein
VKSSRRVTPNDRYDVPSRKRQEFSTVQFADDCRLISRSCGSSVTKLCR